MALQDGLCAPAGIGIVREDLPLGGETNIVDNIPARKMFGDVNDLIAMVLLSIDAADDESYACKRCAPPSYFVQVLETSGALG